MCPGPPIEEYPGPSPPPAWLRPDGVWQSPDGEKGAEKILLHTPRNTN